MLTVNVAQNFNIIVNLYFSKIVLNDSLNNCGCANVLLLLRCFVFIWKDEKLLGEEIIHLLLQIRR